MKAPGKAQAGKAIKIFGEGFKAASKVEIVVVPSHRQSRSRPEEVVSTVADRDGTFRATVPVPQDNGQHNIRVIGTSASGHRAAVQRVVLVVASETSGAGDDLAKPVLLTLAVVIPLATWLVLEFFGWRGRRAG